MVWLDRIYALEQGFPPAKDAMLRELTSESTQHGGQIGLKGWASGPDGIVRMEGGVREHGGKMSANSLDDRTITPYSLSFDATVFPEKGQKP